MGLTHHQRRLTREKIASRLTLIAPMVHRRSAAIEPFRILPLEAARQDAPICADPSTWEVIESGAYWGHSDLNFVMKSAFEVPSGWHSDRVALYLPLGVLGDIFNHPEALAYIDQVPIGSADRYHHTLPLNATHADGQRHVLSLHGWTGHAGWPPDPNSTAKLHMGDCAVVEIDPPTRAFLDLASVAFDALSVLQEELVADAVLSALDNAFLQLDTRDPLGDDFYRSVPAALEGLKADIANAGGPMDVTLHGIGHAHMDIAYLWPVSQIRLKNARTYSNVLRLMDEHEDFRFSHSQPALYEMTAADYPEMFQQIKRRVAEGRWEVMGGMWVEPDLNVPGPEALIRQITLGRNYYQETFGDVETPVLWLPDTFGFPGQIPQLMRLAGLDWFVTNKLNWNQFNRVPWATHLWEGIDGSQVKTHILTTPRDVQYLPFPTNYKSDLSANEVMGTWTHAGSGASKDLPICFGYGDGGGGPTEDLIAKARAFSDFPGMPKLKMRTVRSALEALDKSAEALPVWKGEHYLEGHRGVYTSQGWIKRANRKAEIALHQAEALAAMAGQHPDLTEAWKLLCLNQFHDIVTGTSVPEVYDDARADYARIMDMASKVTQLASEALGTKEVSVASVLPTQGPRTLAAPKNIEAEGQITNDGKLLYFDDLKPYSITPINNACLPSDPVLLTSVGGRIELSNAFLKAVFENGTLVSFVEKTTKQDVMHNKRPGNTLLAFEDRPICWDAWDIDPHYEDRQDEVGSPTSVEVIESGPIRATIRLEYAWRNSKIVQDVTLDAGSRRLDFETNVDWHERHTLLKVAFPVTVTAPEAEFDIQWGKIARSTDRTSDFDAARFEVPMQKWASLSDESLCIALMNDCKYGCDVREDELRLTLVKSATSPDPNADQGAHKFTYSLFASPADHEHLRNHAAYDLNRPPLIINKGRAPTPSSGDSEVAVDVDNVVIETLKPSDKSQGQIIRLFECSGRKSNCTLDVNGEFVSAHKVDFFERSLEELSLVEGSIELDLQPYEITSVLITE